MKKEPMKSTTRTAGTNPATVFAVAALVFLLLLAGCTTQPAPVPVTTVPPTTVQTTVTPMTTVPTPTVALPDPDTVFTDAAGICYQMTPVISNLSTHLDFATCMKNTPLPPGNCARNWRYYVLKSTNEDSTTAGFARQTTTARLAREAFLRGEGYDNIRQVYVPCGNATLITTSFYK
jgi:hypothetical protein